VPRAADPIVATRTVTRVECPAELRSPPPPKPAPPIGAVIDGNPLGLDWIALLGRWGDALAAIIADASAQCPA
jgi:hypothetical protein